MLNLNKHTKTKSKPKLTWKFENCTHVCAYNYTKLSYSTKQFRLFSLLTSR